MVLGVGPDASVAIGDSGTGKSHMLIGLATAAAEKGLGVKYTLATRLVNELVEAADDKILAKTIARHGRLTCSASTTSAISISTAAAPKCSSRR